MTPAQQAALEGLIGRPLTAAEITAIEPLLGVRNDMAIADILSVGRITVVSHLIGERGILDVLGPVAGEAFLCGLESITSADQLQTPLRPYFGALRRGVAWLKTDGLDIGSATTRRLLDLLAGADVVATASVAALKAVPERKNPVHVGAVSDALNGVDNG